MDEALRLCSSHKLGRELTQAWVDADLAAEPPRSAEDEWESQRWMRAYEQCAFESDDPAVDMSDQGWQATYRHAYALDEHDNPTMTDPLAPWPGTEAAHE